jgi:hypothetical protein
VYCRGVAHANEASRARPPRLLTGSTEDGDGCKSCAVRASRRKFGRSSPRVHARKQASTLCRCSVSNVKREFAFAVLQRLSIQRSFAASKRWRRQRADTAAQLHRALPQRTQPRFRTPGEWMPPTRAPEARGPLLPEPVPSTRREQLHGAAPAGFRYRARRCPQISLRAAHADLRGTTFTF